MQSNKLPRVDVIIPAYNASKYIAKTIQSVLAQTLLPHKIIVVDDGSTDNTVALVKSFNNDLIEIISIPNSGVSKARNIGIRASQSEYIAFLDADDLWEEDKLKAQIEALIANPEKKAVYSYAIMCDDNGNLTTKEPAYKNTPYPPGKQFEKLLFEFNNISGSASSVMIDANMLKSTELFDEAMCFAEDIDLWIRIAKQSEFALVPKNHIKIRVHSSSTTRSVVAKSRRRRISDHFYLMNKYAKDYKIPEPTIRISLSLFVSLYILNPIQFFDNYKFFRNLESRAPDYFKQFSKNNNMPTLFMRIIIATIIRFYEKVYFIERTKLFFTEGKIFFRNSKKYNPNVTYIKKKHK